MTTLNNADRDRMTSAPAASGPGGPETLGLDAVLARALETPFHALRSSLPGWTPGDPLSWADWRRVRPMTKDELRALDDPIRDFCMVGTEEVAEFWRSGGVTGRPVFYPRTRADVDASLDAFVRTLEHAGLTASDVLHVSLPLGIHPAGQQFTRSAQRLGAAVVWAGAGNQTAGPEQVRQIHELGATAWCGMPGYALTVAEHAVDIGLPLDTSAVRLVITSGERMSEAKRERLQRLWGARVVDTFGMSELTLLGLECGVQEGFHLWQDIAYCEVLDEDALEPVSYGTEGLLCVTPLTVGHATPFVRWVSGDMVTAHPRCACPLGAHPRVVHTGRLNNFFKIRGVNINHGELEDMLLRRGYVADFRATARERDDLLLEVECREGVADPVARLTREVTESFGVRPTVRVVPRGTVERATAAHVKAARFVDEHG